MAVATRPKHALIARGDKKDEHKTSKDSASPARSHEGINITRVPTEDDEPVPGTVTRSTFHVYSKHEIHNCISPVIDPSKERIYGPTTKEQKARRKEKKERKKSGLPSVDPDDNAFFLHRPYLAFHRPPRVLYMGNTRYGAKPAVLIHEGWFWKEYKLQLGPSIAKPGVLDPRGVVAWKHNGGDKKALKVDDRKLKGYKVRTWRLWGETGKDYVHSVKKTRENGEGIDPDILEEEELKPSWPERADEVVYLRWTNPLSRHTRRYHFQYAGIDFYWKGTGTVKESKRCGILLRFNHLKLVAKLPCSTGDKEKDQPEVCLGKFTSSVASKKNGTLEFFDTTILRLIEEHVPSMLAKDPFEDEAVRNQRTTREDEASKISLMKKSTMYQLIVATAICMIISEKEKRHMLMEFMEEGGGGG